MNITVHRDKPPIQVDDWRDGMGYIRAEAEEGKAIFLPLSLGILDDPVVLKRAKTKAAILAEMEAGR